MKLSMCLTCSRQVRHPTSNPSVLLRYTFLPFCLAIVVSALWHTLIGQTATSCFTTEWRNVGSLVSGWGLRGWGLLRCLEQITLQKSLGHCMNLSLYVNVYIYIYIYTPYIYIYIVYDEYTAYMACGSKPASPNHGRLTPLFLIYFQGSTKVPGF